jgi:hypothetical protein
MLKVMTQISAGDGAAADASSLASEQCQEANFPGEDGRNGVYRA